jgi:hypothetical protein
MLLNLVKDNLDETELCQMSKTVVLGKHIAKKLEEFDEAC